MDIQMPRMDGIEATKQIRKQFSADELPIIALAGLAFADEIEQIFAAEINAFIAKPLHIIMITDVLQAYHD